MMIEIASRSGEGSDVIATLIFASEGDMSWLPKRDKLDPVQASAIGFAVAQEGRRRWRK